MNRAGEIRGKGEGEGWEKARDGRMRGMGEGEGRERREMGEGVLAR
jgi:hypothetical protein